MGCRTAGLRPVGVHIGLGQPHREVGDGGVGPQAAFESQNGDALAGQRRRLLLAEKVVESTGAEREQKGERGSRAGHKRAHQAVIPTAWQAARRRASEDRGVPADRR